MELIQAINEFDSDGMGVIAFSDFLVLMTRRINNSFICTSAGRNAETNKLGLSPDQIERYQRAFSSFDSCGDASIPTNLLGDLIRSLGLSFSREELLQMINEVALAAVLEDGLAIQWALSWASGPAPWDAQVLLEALRQDWRALGLLPPPADSAGFEQSLSAACAEAATSQRGWSLSCAPRFLRSDRELALASVRRDGAALEFAEAMRADKEVALEAVRCSWHAMKFV
ncbi:unnamed protein product, partial [Polarella glacialis]